MAIPEAKLIVMADQAATPIDIVILESMLCGQIYVAFLSTLRHPPSPSH